MEKCINNFDPFITSSFEYFLYYTNIHMYVCINMYKLIINSLAY